MTSILLSSNIILCLNILNFFDRLESLLDYVDNKIESIFELGSLLLLEPDLNIEMYNIKNEDNVEDNVLEVFIERHIKNVEYRKNYTNVINELDKYLIKRSLNLELSPTQQIIGKSLKNKKCVIIYLGLFYDFNKKEWDKEPLLKEIVHTSIKLKIPVVLIGENNPKNFIPILNNALSVHFSKSNYITPYHYKKRWFDSPIRYENNETSNSPCKVSLNQMIDDIVDEYQLGDDVYKIIKFYDINFG